MRRCARVSLAGVALLFVLACSTVGLAPAQSFVDKLAYAYAVDTSILQATSKSVMAGNLSSADAQKVLADSDNAKHMLDAAVEINKTDPKGASTKLDAALAALTAVQAYMTAHQGKH